MRKPKAIIAEDSFEEVFARLANQATTYFDKPPDGPQAVAFGLVWRTLNNLADSMFAYLPSGEKEDAKTLCAAYLGVGLVLAMDKDGLRKILAEVKPKIERLSTAVREDTNANE